MIFIRPDGTPTVAPADLTTPAAKRAYRAAVKAAQRAEAKRIRALVQPQKNAARLRHARVANSEENK